MRSKKACLIEDRLTLEFYATEWEVSQFPIRQINAGSFEKLQIEIAMSVKTYGSSSDVFIDEGFLKVTKGKTKASIRQIHLTDSVKKILCRRIEKFTGDFLFTHQDIDGNKPIESLNILHRSVIKKLGFDFRLYDCRHTFATRAIESGVDLLVLASLLGHSNLQMVMRYAHPSENLKTEAIKKMSLAKAV